VRTAAAEQGVGAANLGTTFAFFDLDEAETRPVNVSDAKSVTDRFEKLYGSKAADEMLASRQYRTGKKL
jgi:hypothetical protein